jgi:UDP-N-acetylmuramoyl-tripeptide--D-alanyl-D-alanine ligase
MARLLFALTLVASALAGVRWLRVAQREHYLAGSVSRFAWRWWRSSGVNVVIAVAAIAAAVAALFFPALALVTIAATAIGPIGLTLRGRTSKLAWTRRLKVLAAVGAVIDLVILLVALLYVRGLFGLAALAVAPIVDLALLCTAPFERRQMQRFVDDATATLRSVRPTTVAITGSYGKTTTKLYVAHLLQGQRSVLASPASFNNTGGLSRTINEQLRPGTQVFVAEMGLYRPGEIRDLCSWVQPDIGVIVNIGPVHLERAGSIEGIVAAKSEITENVGVAVLNVDATGLRELADRLSQQGRRVVTCSTANVNADVAVIGRDGGFEAYARGSSLGSVVASDAHPANVACALGVVLALDIEPSLAAGRLNDLPISAHRQELATSAKGVTVIDNTFSSNPASAAASLDLLRRHTVVGHRAVVVTPGMVELGPRQAVENEAFGRDAASNASDVLVVGRTNRAALLRGAPRARSVRRRDDAVTWVRSTLTHGDVVLYENDLPDHYP